MVYLYITIFMVFDIIIMWTISRINYSKIKSIKLVLVTVLAPVIFFVVDVLVNVYVFKKNGYPTVETGTLAVVFLLMYIYWLFNFMLEKIVQQQTRLSEKVENKVIDTVLEVQKGTFNVFKYVLLLPFIYFQYVYFQKFLIILKETLGLQW